MTTMQALTTAEALSVRNVVARLEEAADGAPTPFMRALWRRLAANVRWELTPADDAVGNVRPLPSGQRFGPASSDV